MFMGVRSYELLVASYWLKQFSLREKGGYISAEKGGGIENAAHFVKGEFRRGIFTS